MKCTQKVSSQSLTNCRTLAGNIRSEILSGEETLFIVDDMIADETLDKKHTVLLDLAVSGRHRIHSFVDAKLYRNSEKPSKTEKAAVFVVSVGTIGDAIASSTDKIKENGLIGLEKGQNYSIYIKLYI